jgi:hypothetical protein
LLPYLERVYMAAVQQCLNSESCDPDCAIRWSRRWLDQQQIVSNSSAQPRLDHRDRMKSLSQAIAVRVREGKATEIATQKMQASLQEAELLLN